MIHRVIRDWSQPAIYIGGRYTYRAQVSGVKGGGISRVKIPNSSNLLGSSDRLLVVFNKNSA